MGYADTSYNCGSRVVSDKIIIFFATGFYTGYAPIAPGTIGTLLGIPLGFFISRLAAVHQVISILTAFFLFSFVGGKAESIFNKKDASHIVCDEVLGFIVAMLFIPYTLYSIIIAFFLFRIFDILKPFPIRLIDRNIKNGYGIVLDDVAAGVYANLVFRIIEFLY